MFRADNARRECFFILLLFIAICISFSSKGIDSAWFNNRLVFWLGRYSLPLYLSHTYWSQNLNYILPARFTDWERMGVYLLCSVATSFFLWGICALIRKALPKLCSCIKRLLLAS
jgi:peptidoglycan/LPS O-acetylase OafA/YrhL